MTRFIFWNNRGSAFFTTDNPSNTKGDNYVEEDSCIMKREYCYTPDELRIRWNVSKNTIYNYIRKGLLPHIRIDRRIMIPVSTVLECEAKNLFRTKKDREKYIRESLADFQKGGSA